MGVRGALPAFVAGLIAASFQLPPSLPLPLAVLGAALAWFGVRGRFPRLALCAWLAFFALAGMSLYHLRLEPPRAPSHIISFAGPETHRLEGRVLELSRRAEGSYVADLEVSRLFEKGGPLAVHGRMRLYLGSGEAAFRSGQTVRFRSRLRRPRLFGTPGEFDYVRYLAARDIFVTGYIESPEAVAPIVPAGWRDEPFRAAWQRQRIGELIDAAAPDVASLVRALVIGDKKAVGQDTREVMSRSGLAHLFSVSGLHLGMTAGFLYLTLLFIYRRSERLLLWQPPKRVLPLLLLLPLWGYVLLTGGAMPTQRAFIFFAAGALLLFFSRSVRPWRILEAAALALLAIEPLALFEPSFQLSFAGVAGILAVLSRKKRQGEAGGAVRRFFVRVFVTTAVATLATLPLVVWHFHLVAPAGLVANMFAVPLVAFVALPLGLAGLLLSFAWPGAAQVLFLLCGVILQGCLDLAKGLLEWPALSGWQVYATPGQAFGVALLVAAVFLCLGGGRRRLPPVVLGAVGGLLLTGALASRLGPSVTFFSVGQGESCLVSLGDGRHVLVDGGGLYGDRFDVGERLLLPALAHLGVHRLEAVILTHDHPDHRKGLLAVLRSLDVGAFLTGDDPAHLHPDLRRVLTEAGVPVRTLPAGWHRFSGATDTEEEVSLFVPPRSLPDENDRSIVVYYRFGGQGVLLTGDLEAVGVRYFVERAPKLAVGLLKLPHHGSRHSRSEMLLDVFGPEIIAVSAGYENPYHLPATELLDEIARREIPVYRTDLDGTVRVGLSAGGFIVKRWKRGLFR